MAGRKGCRRATREDRFWAKVTRSVSDECWYWAGCKNKQGYGQFRDNGRTRLATHVSWEIFHGRDFPEGKIACHICDVPSCVNPNHLWAGTKSENSKDCWSKGRHSRKRGTHCPNGHEYSEENTHYRPNGEACCRQCNRDRMARYRRRVSTLGATR